MQRKWMLRLIEVVAVVAFIAEIWRFLRTNNTTTDLVVDAVELAGLIVVGIVCLLSEWHFRQASRERVQ